MSPIKRQCVYINKLYPNLFISSRIYGGFIQIIPFIIMNHTNDDWILKRSEKKQSILLSFIYWVPFFDRMRKVREESQFGNGDVHFETSNLCHVLIWCSFFVVASNSKQMIILRRIGWKKISRIRSHSSLPWHCTSSAHKKLLQAFYHWRMNHFNSLDDENWCESRNFSEKKNWRIDLIADESNKKTCWFYRWMFYLN